MKYFTLGLFVVLLGCHSTQSVRPEDSEPIMVGTDLEVGGYETAIDTVSDDDPPWGDSGSESGGLNDTETSTNSGINVDSDTESDTIAGTDAGTDSSLHFDTDSDSDSETDTGTGTDTGADTGADTGTDTDTGIDTSPVCADLICGDDARCDDSGVDPVCVCDDGFEGDGYVCTDIDECVSGAEQCDDEHGECFNYAGGYRCDCEQGWQVAMDEHSCVEREIFLQVSVGSWHSCAIREDQTITCFGANRPDTCVAPEGTFQKVSCGDNLSCALRTGGEIVCWGDGVNGTGNLSISPPAGPHVDIELSGVGQVRNTFCALQADGAVVCFGNEEGVIVNSPDGLFSQISGGYYPCGLTDVGEISCWKLHDTDEDFFVPPVGVFVDVATSSNQICGLSSAGVLSCSSDSEDMMDTPTGTFTSISSGETKVCGIRENGSVKCWGRPQTFENCEVYEKFGSYQGISSASCQFCGIQTDGTLECWGANNISGGLTPPDYLFKEISVNFLQENVWCGVRTNSTVKCSGFLSTSGNTPNSLETTEHYEQIISVSDDIVGLKLDGKLSSLTDTVDSDLPDGSDYIRISDGDHTAVYCVIDGGYKGSCNDYYMPPDSLFVQLEPNYYGACGVHPSGSMECWSDLDIIELDTDDVLLSYPTGIVVDHFSLSNEYACVIGHDGSLHCWGDSEYIPQTSLAGPYSYVETHEFGFCALLSEGGMDCFGDVPAADDLVWQQPLKQVSINNVKTCALTTEGKVVCRGDEWRN